jgi:hypothetical protein
MRALVVFGIVATCVIFSGAIFSLAIPVLICYGIYYMIWASVIRPGLVKQAQRERAAAGDDVVLTEVVSNAPADGRTALWQPADPSKLTPPPTPSARRRRARPNWRDRANQELAAKPFREKLSELMGSMIVAAMFAALSACIAPMMLGNNGGTESLPMYMWLALVGTLGSWAILVPSKFAEGKLEDQVPMRISLLAAGAAVGLAAWFLGDALMVNVPSWREPVDAGRGLVSQEMLDLSKPQHGMNPDAAVFMTYFAFLFLVPRWWRQGESTRTGRVSLWATIVCVFWAWLLHFFWWFPQPTGMMA